MTPKDQIYDYGLWSWTTVRNTQQEAAKTCAELHTPMPEEYYFRRRTWVEKMQKTHEQRRCPNCGLWAIWEEK